MIFISVSDKCIVNHEVPVSKFVEKNESNEDASSIKRIVWYASIKPDVSAVKASISENMRYEEIQLLEITLTGREFLYDAAKSVFAHIKYPCVIEFYMGDVICIGCCSFSPGKKDYTENVKKSLIFSHFLHRDILSPQAKNMIDRINIILTEEGQYIADMYSGICGALLGYKLGGTSRAHVDRLIEDMIGKASSSRKAEIRQYCIPYEFHQTIDGSGKYGNRRKYSNYTLVHDYEEIWYSFMKDPQISSIIEKRRYRDMEDLVFSIDSKGW